jgi:hypothetical protein
MTPATSPTLFPGLGADEFSRGYLGFRRAAGFWRYATMTAQAGGKGDNQAHNAYVCCHTSATVDPVQFKWAEVTTPRSPR